MMTCKECGQVGDWVGSDVEWTPVDGTSVSGVTLVECRACGNRQLTVEP